MEDKTRFPQTKLHARSDYTFGHYITSLRRQSEQDIFHSMGFLGQTRSSLNSPGLCPILIMCMG
jgi:hypothetical protein